MVKLEHPAEISDFLPVMRTINDRMEKDAIKKFLTENLKVEIEVKYPIAYSLNKTIVVKLKLEDKIISKDSFNIGG